LLIAAKPPLCTFQRWKGFTAEGDTWESRENLQNAGELLREFKEEYGRDNRKVR